MFIQHRATELWGGWSHPETTRTAATQSVGGPVGVSPLPAGEGHASWRRSEDLPCVSVCADCKLHWWFPFCFSAYTNDVVLAVQRSQMLICLLSADYLSNSNAVFELESGVQVGFISRPDNTFMSHQGNPGFVHVIDFCSMHRVMF